MLLQYVYAFFVLYSYLLVTAVTLVFGRPYPREWHLRHSLGTCVVAASRGKAFLNFCFLGFSLAS